MIYPKTGYIRFFRGDISISYSPLFRPDNQLYILGRAHAIHEAAEASAGFGFRRTCIATSWRGNVRFTHLG